MLWHVTVHRMLHVTAQMAKHVARSLVYKPKSNQIEVVAAAAAAATVATNEV